MININKISKYIITIIWILLLQITLFDNLLISQYVYIPVYLLFIISIPKRVKSINAMIISFIYGLIIDHYTGSGGAITSALVLTAAIRGYVISKVIFIDSNINNKSVTIKYTNPSNYILYISIIILVFNTSLALIEGIPLLSPTYIITKIGLSTIVTIPIIALLQYVIYDNFD